MVKNISRFWQNTLFHRKGCSSHYRWTIEIRNGRVEPTGHQWPDMAATHKSCYVMPDIKGSQNLPGRRKLSLCSDQSYRVIFSGIFPGDIMKALGWNWYCLMAGCPRKNAFNYILFCISEQGCQIIQIFWDTEFNGFILLNITNVHYPEFESLAYLGTENQPRAIHGVSKGQIKGEIVSTGIRFVGSKKDKSFIFSFFNL